MSRRDRESHREAAHRVLALPDSRLDSRVRGRTIGVEQSRTMPMVVAMVGMGSALVALVSLGMTGHYYWERLFGEDGPQTLRRFLVWLGKGLMAPLLLWTVFNASVLPGLPPLVTPTGNRGPGAGSWLVFVSDLLGPSFMVIGSLWAAVTITWLLSTVSTRVENRQDFRGLSLFWGLFCSPVAGLILYWGGWDAVGFAVLACLIPILHATLPLMQRQTPLPLYARAIARMKFGKYAEAEQAVIHELERCADDFEGWMMLADLYANHFSDLPEAARTIHALCSQPNLLGVQISLAFHRLANWHLKPGDDPVSARQALEEICQRLPGSHFARMARQRIDQLPASREELLEQLKVKSIPLPALADDLDEAVDHRPPEMSPELAAALANHCVERLQQDPNDAAARERFARLLADQLRRVDLALEQVELLLGMPNPPPGKAVEWLALLAAWQLKYRKDEEAARPLLERLIREYPQSAQAFAAQRRLNLLKREHRNPGLTS